MKKMIVFLMLILLTFFVVHALEEERDFKEGDLSADDYNDDDAYPDILENGNIRMSEVPDRYVSQYFDDIPDSQKYLLDENQISRVLNDGKLDNTNLMQSGLDQTRLENVIRDKYGMDFLQLNDVSGGITINGNTLSVGQPPKTTVPLYKLGYTSLTVNSDGSVNVNQMTVLGNIVDVDVGNGDIYFNEPGGTIVTGTYFDHKITVGHARVSYDVEGNRIIDAYGNYVGKEGELIASLDPFIYKYDPNRLAYTLQNVELLNYPPDFMTDEGSKAVTLTDFGSTGSTDRSVGINGAVTVVDENNLELEPQAEVEITETTESGVEQTVVAVENNGDQPLEVTVQEEHATGEPSARDRFLLTHPELEGRSPSVDLTNFNEDTVDARDTDNTEVSMLDSIRAVLFGAAENVVANYMSPTGTVGCSRSTGNSISSSGIGCFYGCPSTTIEPDGTLFNTNIDGSQTIISPEDEEIEVGSVLEPSEILALTQDQMATYFETGITPEEQESLGRQEILVAATFDVYSDAGFGYLEGDIVDPNDEDGAIIVHVTNQGGDLSGEDIPDYIYVTPEGDDWKIQDGDYQEIGEVYNEDGQNALTEERNSFEQTEIKGNDDNYIIKSFWSGGDAKGGRNLQEWEAAYDDGERPEDMSIVAYAASKGDTSARRMIQDWWCSNKGGGGFTGHWNDEGVYEIDQRSGC